MGRMPIVHPCSAAGCTTLTMGELCLEHEHVAATQVESQGRGSVARAALIGLAAGLAAALLARARVML
jgi:hypothetical protein